MSEREREFLYCTNISSLHPLIRREREGRIEEERERESEKKKKIKKMHFPHWTDLKSLRTSGNAYGVNFLIRKMLAAGWTISAQPRYDQGYYCD